MEGRRNDAGRSEQRKLIGFQNVIRLGYVSLFTDLSTEMILGVLPIFIVNELGATAALLGIIEGTAEAVNDFFRVLTGLITDRIARRKPLIVLGYALSSIAKPLFALTSTWGQAFVVRVVDRAGKGARTSPRDALISDSIAKSEAGKAFGVHGSLDQVGAVLGPLIAFVAIPLIGLRGVFWLSFAPAAVSLIILIYFVKDAKGLTRQRHMFANASEVLNRRFIILLAVLGVFSIGAYNFSFVLLKASNLGVSNADITLVYATLNVATIILGLPAGVLADRIGKVPVLCLSYLIFLVTSVSGAILEGNWAYGYLLAFLFGGYLGASDTVQRAIIPDFVRAELKGTAYACYYILIGLSSLVANSIFGFLWTSVSSLLAFEYSIATSVVSIIAITLFLVVSRK